MRHALAVVEHIGWFNTSRLHASLGYLTPDESRTKRSIPGPNVIPLGPRRRSRTEKRWAAGLSDE